MRVVGAGPAGATAALAACRQGARVQLFEKAQFPRHKVCGEFLSPDAALILEKLGVLSPFLDLKPFAVTRARLVLGRTTKKWRLDEPAFGISRFALDNFLLSAATKAGAQLVRETAIDLAGPIVIAAGRHKSAPPGRRHFGFKAHFDGPMEDSIDLFFDRSMYVGINCVEDGSTNVCGLAPEDLLKKFGFEPDALTRLIPALAERLRPLRRKMDWLITGPLVYGGDFATESAPDVYLAGDALGFVDPFTGSGMLGAMTTGFLAGDSCARGLPASAYRACCRAVLGNQYHVATLLRKLVMCGVAEQVSWLLPGRQLFRLTRPNARYALKKPGQQLGG